MRNRNPIRSEDDFINAATSLPNELAKKKRIRKYKAISVSLTDSIIEYLDTQIQELAILGVVGITRSDVVKAALDNFQRQPKDFRAKIIKLQKDDQ